MAEVERPKGGNNLVAGSAAIARGAGASRDGCVGSAAGACTPGRHRERRGFACGPQGGMPRVWGDAAPASAPAISRTAASPAAPRAASSRSTPPSPVAAARALHLEAGSAPVAVGAGCFVATATSVPALNSASSATSASNRRRIAATNAPAGPFRVPSAAMDARIPSRIVGRRSAGGGVAVIISIGTDSRTAKLCQGNISHPSRESPSFPRKMRAGARAPHHSGSFPRHPVGKPATHSDPGRGPERALPGGGKAQR
jgi:hypothetical protein